MEKIKVSDYEAVLATVAKYTDACKEGKSDIMKPSVHSGFRSAPSCSRCFRTLTE